MDLPPPIDQEDDLPPPVGLGESTVPSSTKPINLPFKPIQTPNQPLKSVGARPIQSVVPKPTQPAQRFSPPSKPASLSPKPVLPAKITSSNLHRSATKLPPSISAPPNLNSDSTDHLPPPIPDPVRPTLQARPLSPKPTTNVPKPSSTASEPELPPPVDMSYQPEASMSVRAPPTRSFSMPAASQQEDLSVEKTADSDWLRLLIENRIVYFNTVTHVMTFENPLLNSRCVKDLDPSSKSFHLEKMLLSNNEILHQTFRKQKPKQEGKRLPSRKPRSSDDIEN